MENEVCERCRLFFERLLKEIEELKRRLLAYENAHTPPSMRWKKRLPPSNAKLGAPEGHPGTTRDEPEPTMTMKFEEQKCHHCQARLDKPFRVERRVIEEIPEPQPVEVTEYLIGHYECNKCGGITIADAPIPEGRFGPQTCAHIALLKFGDRLPNRLVVRALERDFGLTITSATVLDITRRVADATRAEYEKLVEQIQKSPFVHIDETQLRVSGRTYWVWIFTTPTQTLYVIKPTRGKTVPKEILGDYQGIIITDGYKVYPEFGSAQQRCWAHLLREARELAEKHETAQPILQQLLTMYHELKPLCKRKKINHQHVYESFMLRMNQIIDLCNAYQEIRKFATTLKNGINSWFTALLHKGVPLTNNLAERQLREIVVQRKIFGTLRNEKGTRIMETIMSMLMTWKQRQINPLTRLQKLLRS